MRCYCCNKILTPQESTRKFADSGEYTDMCNACLDTIDVSTEDGYIEEHTDEEGLE